MSSVLGHGHGTEYIWITTSLSWVGGLSVYLSVWARNRKRLRLRYGYRYGETVMAHIGADCIALHLQMQLGMDSDMFSLFIFVSFHWFGIRFCFLDMVMMDVWYVGT